MRHRNQARGTVLVGLAAALAVVVVVWLFAADPGRAHQRCTHGVSSIGPVYIANGKVVGGDTTPDTQACLP
jgi:uncharacterized membrane protein YhiD involved in acid resistance